MTFGSLFAGIGGFDLGFERAGLTCAWQVEIDEFCRRVLAKHWPAVRRHDDVRTFPPTDAADWRVDVICGGFPCQPHSTAGRRKGADDHRWLWPEFARVVRLLRPDWVVVENVPGLLSVQDGNVFGSVLGELAASGYDAEWDCVPAAAFGAPHLRYRAVVVAHPAGRGVEERVLSARPRPERAGTADPDRGTEGLAAHTDRAGPAVGEGVGGHPGEEQPTLSEVLEAAYGGPDGGVINPEWAAWYMGFPPGWCDLPSTGSETPSSPSSPNGSGDN